MPKVKDISNQKFGRLTALYRLHNTKGRTKWLCICDCGNLTEVITRDLTTGNTKSCGCLHKEGLIERNKYNAKHNKCDTRLYSIWTNMKDRCYNDVAPNYPNYGGRGIAVCSEWKDDFTSFYDWSINNWYKDTLTIDRIDVDGNYEPSNCRWATDKQQARNRRNNRNYSIRGVTHCLMEWCEIYNINYQTVVYRLNHGCNIEKALELELE